MIDWILNRPVLIVSVLVAGLIFILYVSVQEERRWQEFVRVNDCGEIARRSNPDSLVLINNMPHYISQPDTVTWRCEDGDEYVR